MAAIFFGKPAIFGPLAGSARVFARRSDLFRLNLVTDDKAGPFSGLVFNDPNAGWTLEALGRLAARQWLAGEIPWWNPFSGIGVPLAAEMQPAALFFPFILLLNFDHGLLFLKIAIQIVAGFSTYALLRHLKLGPPAASVGGALYELNGSFAWFWNGPSLVAAFLPLFLLGIERAYAASQLATERHSRFFIRGWRTIALAMAYSLYAGFPETAYIDGLFALGWAAYRFVNATAPVRIYFFALVGFGGVVGLCLAAPIVWPFAHFILNSWLGGHDGASRLAEFNMPAPGFALFLFPYLFGPMAAFVDVRYPILWTVWTLASGYVGLNLLFVGLLGLFGGSYERGLRWLLGAWVVIALAQTAALPGITWLFRQVPLIDQTIFARYATPSWIMAVVILISFAIEDNFRREFISRHKQWIALLACGCAAVLALALAWPYLTELYRSAVTLSYFSMASLLWGIVGLTLIAVLFSWRRRQAVVFAAIFLVCESSAFFVLPLFSGKRTVKVDTEGVQFLERNLGLQRFYTIGPIAPNYGAYFGVPSINLNYLPVPKLWTDYVSHELGVEVSGTGTGMHSADLMGALRQHLPAYRSLGVKYLVAGADYHLGTLISAAVDYRGDHKAQALGPGSVFSDIISGDVVVAGEIKTFGLVIGTYQGKAEGSFAVKLCTPTDCSEGVGKLELAVDNQMFRIALNRPLKASLGDPLTYTITRPDGNDVAIWFWSTLGTIANAAAQSFSPAWMLEYRGEPDWPVAFQNRAMTVFELPDAAPYFGMSGGPCSLDVQTRQNVLAVCSAPGTLVRRELAFPGWQVSLNGNTASLAITDQIFQSVDLPAGTSQVVFSYAPPGIRWAYAAFFIGVFAFFASAALRGARLQ